VTAGVDVQDVLEAADDWYRDQLRRSPEARDYLTARGVPGDLADRLGLGYAPDRWRGLTDHLLRHRVSEERAVAAGLAMPTARNVCDKLRGRVVFPVRDETGHLVGFTGRAAPGSSPNAPKYLDTLARGGKSRALHGLADGLACLARGATPVLVEGPLDRIAVTRVTGGRYVGLAPGGTGLTAQHIAALDRVTRLQGRRVVVAFDGDPAGHQAALAAYPLLRQAGALPELATVGVNSDPADLAVRSPRTLAAALRETTPLEDAVVDARLAEWTGRTQWAEGVSGALHSASRVVVELPAGRHARQVARIADRLDVPAAVVTGALLDVLDERVTQSSQGRASPSLALRVG
jgi:DNA primase